MTDHVMAEAVTVVTALAPGVLSRNRHFGLFRDKVLKHARARGRVVRETAIQVRRAKDVEIEINRLGTEWIVAYRIPSLKLSCRIEMTDLERACFVYLCTRAGMTALTLTPDDETRVEQALASWKP